MNPIEDRVWEYIDGFCSLEEQEIISQLIVNDPVYRDKYAELMDLQQNINLLEIDEPPMAFTNKVMDKITLQSKPLSAKATIDKRIIYGISALFGIMLLVCLVVIINNIDWTTSINIPENITDNYKAVESKFSISAANKTALMYSFFMFDIIAGLMLLDKYLRKRLV
jgi:hypothetical protein